MKQNFRDWSSSVSYMTKMIEDNYMSDHTGVVYIENDTKLSWTIE